MDLFDLQKMVAFQPDKMAKVDVVQSKQMMCGLNCFEPGQAHKVHAHSGADKLYYVVEGSGEFEVDGETRTLSAGQLLHVPSGVPHGVANTSTARLAVLIVIAPNPMG